LNINRHYTEIKDVQKYQNYTDTEQVCKKHKSVPIGITDSKKKLLRIFPKIQYKINIFNIA